MAKINALYCSEHKMAPQIEKNSDGMKVTGCCLNFLTLIVVKLLETLFFPPVLKLTTCIEDDYYLTIT